MNAKITTKYILGIMALISLFGFAGVASASLSEYYSTRGLSLPPVAVRAETAAEVGIFNYKGTREQNILLEQRLKELEDQQEGSVLGYSVVSRYKTTLASSMTTSQTTVPVSSITTFDGHTLSMSDLGSKIYLTIEPGTSREEIAVCTAISSSQWSSCTRGLAFYGTSETGVAANKKAHNAGSVVVMSNVHYAYENLVDKDSGESLNGLKTFSTFPQITTSTALPSSNAEFATKYYVDNVGAGGFTSVNVSSTRGLEALGTSPEKVGVNASSTRGFDFDANGALYLKDGSNSGIYFDSNGIAVERYDTYNWEGAHKFGSNLNVSSTFQSTQPLTVFSNSSSSTLPRIATDYISATTTGANVTTTVVNNLQVNGNIDATGTNFAQTLIKTGQGSQAANTTGDQVVTHNLNFIPALIKIYANAHNMGTGSDIGVSTGTATTASDETCTYLSHVSTSGPGTSASGQTSSIICLYDSTGTAYARATLDGVTTTTFTLNWVINYAAGSARYYQWEVYR